MPFKLIIGAGWPFELACEAWRSARPDLQVQPIEVTQDQAYAFDLSFLDRYSPEDAGAFAAFDNRFLNFKRLELMALIKSRGFRLEPLISPRAHVAETARIGENCFIDDGSVVGPRAELQYNCFVGAGVIIGMDARIAHSAWIERGAVLGGGTRIGSHTTLGSGVIVADGVDIGRCCVVEIPGTYRRDIPAKTFLNPDFDEPLRTIDHGSS